MLTRLALFFCVVCAIVLVGCSKSESNTNGNATTGNAKKAASTTTPASTTATASADKIGVPECDAFIASYEACVSDKVPAAVQPQLKSGLAQWRASWKKLAENPQTKGTLAGVCKQQLEGARASMKAYGCTF